MRPAHRTQPDPNGDVRCSCRRLLMRIVAEGIEVRCSRCGTDVVVMWKSIELQREPACDGDD